MALSLPMLADSDLFTLVVFMFFAILSGISSWLQKRRESKEAEHEAEWGEPDDEGAPVPASPAEAAQEESPLERELRRLLMGDQPAPPPPPEAVMESSEAAAIEENVAAEHSALLETAQSAYAEASYLGDAMAEHMAEIDARTKHPIATPVPLKRRDNSTIRAVRTQLQHPSTARQAILASIILAPPPGLR